jgi:hypothetical protein
MDLCVCDGPDPQPRHLLIGGKEAPLFDERALRALSTHRRHPHMGGNGGGPYMDFPAYVDLAPQPRHLLIGGEEALLFDERALRAHSTRLCHPHMSGDGGGPCMDFPAYVNLAPQPCRLLIGGEEAPHFNGRAVRAHSTRRCHPHMGGDGGGPCMDLPAYFDLAPQPLSLLIGGEEAPLSYKRALRAHSMRRRHPHMGGDGGGLCMDLPAYFDLAPQPRCLLIGGEGAPLFNEWALRVYSTRRRHPRMGGDVGDPHMDLPAYCTGPPQPCCLFIGSKEALLLDEQA